MKVKKANTSPGGKTAKIVILFSIVLFGILIVSAFVWFSRTGILDVFKGKWILFKGLSNFLLFFPAFFCSILLISISMFSSFLAKTSRSFSSYAVLFIVLMMLYTGFREIGKPRIQNRLENIRYLTQSGEDLIEAAFAAERENNYQRAYQNLKRYREIDSNNPDINRAFDRIKRKYAAEQTAVEEPVAEESEPVQLPQQNTALSLTQKASELLEQDKYHTAYYYATIARELGSRKAEGVQEEAWNKITNVTPGREIEKNRLLFTQKAEGQSALSYGNIIEAYYLFLKLHQNYPGDSEISKFLEETQQKIEERAFFLEEVIQALSYPGYPEIFFILRNSENRIQLFYAGTGVVTKDGIFFEDIEIITLDTAANAVTEHLYAPYGKCLQKTLLMHCIHRTEMDIQYRPRYLAAVGNGPPPFKLVLPFQPSEFQHFSRREHNTDILSFGDLLYLRKLWPSRGYRAEPVYIELLMRIMYPFSFLVFAFFTLSIGIRTKNSSEQISTLSFILIPFLPLLIYYIMNFFYYLNRVFLTFVNSWLGFPVALILLFVLQGLLLLISIGHSMKRMQRGIGS